MSAEARLLRLRDGATVLLLRAVLSCPGRYSVYMCSSSDAPRVVVNFSGVAPGKCTRIDVFEVLEAPAEIRRAYPVMLCGEPRGYFVVRIRREG